MLKIGFGQGDITPPGKISLNGQHYQRISTKVHSNLKAVAVFMEKNNERAIWVACDLVGVNPDLTKCVSEKLAQIIPNFHSEQLILSATHTHTGPFLRRKKEDMGFLLSMWNPDEATSTEECVRVAVNGITEAVIEAYENCEPCYVETAIARIQTGCCRRVVYKDGTAQMYGDVTRPDFAGMEGRDGDRSSFMYVRRSSDDALTGIIASVPCTAQVLEGKNYISSDYWGYVREQVCEDFGKDVKLVGLVAAAGDLSPRDLVCTLNSEPNMRDEDGCQALAMRIAKAIREHYEYPLESYKNDIIFEHIYENVGFPVWRCTKEDYEESLKKLKEYNEKYDYDPETDTYPLFPGKDYIPYRKELIKVSRYERKSPFTYAPIHAVRIGGAVLISNPFELYIEYADRIKAACKGIHVFDVELTYTSYSYMPTKIAVKHDGYSAQFNQCVVHPNGGELLVEKSINLIKNLFN
jgi:hypothetical protein